MPPLIALDRATVARGQAIYASQCASCHGANGRGDGPSASALPSRPADQTNYRVMDAMNDLTLARRIQAGGLGMPSFPQLRGDDLVALVGYVRRLSRPATHGVELHGLAQDEVRGFEAVSEAALAAPPPEDWLSFRGTPDSAAFSRLTEITHENVGRLQLAWSRAMEPGGQYSTPLVRAGTMFIAHPGDVIQALDATTGDLIWEFRWANWLGHAGPGRNQRAARPRAPQHPERRAPRRTLVPFHRRRPPHRAERAHRHARVVVRRGGRRHGPHGRPDDRRRQDRQRAIVRRHRRTGDLLHRRARAGGRP